MKIKSIFPYLLFGSLVFTPKGIDKIHKTHNSNLNQSVVTTTTHIPQEKADKKAQELCEVYIDLVLQGQKNIKNSKGSHRDAVLKEFPGAVVRFYCIYGQYTQLNRAVAELGDTLNLIPFSGRHACPTFRTEMKKKYSGKEYTGALHSGKMFKSDAAYNQALQAFLKHNKVTDKTPQDVRDKVIARFKANNFSAEVLHPGTILIIQKSATPSNTHAVMYLGRGHVEKDKFIPDPDGQFIYAGYNNESIGDIFTTYNTNYIFAADIQTIASVTYSKELQKIQRMDYEDLFRFVYDMPSDMYAMAPTYTYLQAMAESKYFDKQQFQPLPVLSKKNVATINLLPPIHGLLKTR